MKNKFFEPNRLVFRNTEVPNPAENIEKDWDESKKKIASYFLDKKLKDGTTVMKVPTQDNDFRVLDINGNIIGEIWANNPYDYTGHYDGDFVARIGGDHFSSSNLAEIENFITDKNHPSRGKKERTREESRKTLEAERKTERKAESQNILQITETLTGKTLAKGLKVIESPEGFLVLDKEGSEIGLIRQGANWERGSFSFEYTRMTPASGKSIQYFDRIEDLKNFLEKL